MRTRGHKIELRHLRYLVAAAECGSFRRAARALEINESAVSRRIRDLEDEIGAALFIRTHGGVELTQAGQAFLVHARWALAQIGHAAWDAGAFGRAEAGVVRIGILASPASGFLCGLLHAYVAKNPGIRPNLVEGNATSHIASVQGYCLDVAFLTDGPLADECEREHLWSERLYAALPTGHELAAKAEVSWADLCDRRFIVSNTGIGPRIEEYLVEHFARLDHHAVIDRCGVGTDNLMQLVAMGQGLTLTSEVTSPARFPGVVYRPLIAETLPFYAVWSPRNDNPALRRLLSLARTMSTQRGSCAEFPITPSPTHRGGMSGDQLAPADEPSRNLDPSQ